MWAGVTAHNLESKPPARSRLKVDYGWSLFALIPPYSAVLEATSIRIAKCCLFRLLIPIITSEELSPTINLVLDSRPNIELKHSKHEGFKWDNRQQRGVGWSEGTWV